MSIIRFRKSIRLVVYSSGLFAAVRLSQKALERPSKKLRLKSHGKKIAHGKRLYLSLLISDCCAFMNNTGHWLEATSFRIMISENLCSWLLRAKRMTASEGLKKGRMEMLYALSINFNVVLISWLSQHKANWPAVENINWTGSLHWKKTWHAMNSGVYLEDKLSSVSRRIFEVYWSNSLWGLMIPISFPFVSKISFV